MSLSIHKIMLFCILINVLFTSSLLILTQSGNAQLLEENSEHNFSPLDNVQENISLTNLQTRYVGGIGDEWGGVSKIDSEDNLILAGESGSSELELVNEYQAYGGGSADGIIIKYSPDGNISFSTFLGGSSNDYVNEIAIDYEDNIIVMGESTDSKNLDNLDSRRLVIAVIEL